MQLHLKNTTILSSQLVKGHEDHDKSVYDQTFSVIEKKSVYD